ncbi:CDK5RAP3-like protein [Stomoxys calcitrans]|uniref:CDK5RAP3-like protein n=1 Tax=Stomoxys calcitrans TaxID=35570 RepID=UPI0027E249A6|nr:CDK5RAP3-like protein [Stomoxys calcitrans]
MNEADIPIDIHTLKLQDWLVSRRIVPKNIQANLKDIRSKITSALMDMPSHEKLIELLKGTNINYYHCKEIIEILKQTEKDTKGLFGSYGSKRMKDWQEIVRLYEKDNIYLAETAQIYVRNVNYEVPNVRKQMTKLEQQSDESLKRSIDLAKPEAQLLNEHAALLQQIGVKGENLREEFTQVLLGLPDIYAKSIKKVGTLDQALDLYATTSGQTKQQCLPITRHLMELGNTTVYQYIHKEAPLSVEEPPIKLNLSQEHEAKSNDNEIDFGDDNGGASSTISGEMIDFGELNLESGGETIDFGDTGEGGDIDWGIESSPTENVEVNFDIPIEEYGIVVEGAGMDGGVAKGDQAYTILDSPNYRERFTDELYELEAFLRMRCYELRQVNANSNVMFSLMESISTHDEESLKKMLSNVEAILSEISNEQTRHLFQLKHSPKYADLLASKLKQMIKAVEKIRLTKQVLKDRSVELKEQRLALNPVLEELVAQTKNLQTKIEQDISKRYKNRVVNLLGGV